MSATAKLLIDAGATVTGSDEAIYSPVAEFLRENSISYATPYAPENIPAEVDCIVIGKNAKLAPEINAEVREAHARGVRIASFPEIVAELAQGKTSVVIAGSYGKSTTAALIAHCLSEAGLDPSFMIGAIPFSPETSARLGTGEYFVIEGDEYPSSHSDTRSKFLHFNPEHLLVTPLSHDHLNVFPTKEEYLAPFYELTKRVPTDGSITASLHGDLSPQYIEGISKKVTTFSLAEGDWHAGDISYGDITRFTIVNSASPVISVKTRELGSHSVENIVGAAALLIGQNIVSPDQFAAAVASFRGIRRRLDLKSQKTSVRIYEGFGSSIEKAKAAIAAMKLHFPAQRLIIAFEPHTFSWRNRAALPWYDTVFIGAHQVFIYEPASQGADTHAQIKLSDIVSRVQTSGVSAVGIENAEDGLAALRSSLKPDDVVLILTSGDMGGMVASMPKLAEELYPA